MNYINYDTEINKNENPEEDEDLRRFLRGGFGANRVQGISVYEIENRGNFFLNYSWITKGNKEMCLESHISPPIFRQAMNRRKEEKILQERYYFQFVHLFS